MLMMIETKIIPEDSLQLAKMKVRFLRLVRFENNCMVWIGSIFNGYGRFSIGFKKYQAHRISYLLFKGEIESGLVVDHLCKNKSCVKPEHLETVPLKENTLRANSPTAINARKTHCIRGHPLSDKTNNIKQPQRVCRICVHENYLTYHAIHKAEHNARDRQYYQDHKEERKAWQRAYNKRKAEERKNQASLSLK